jgi:LysR family glycine cleavage system transcriptional activator
MARKLPPLHLLQLFEAAGRNVSFKKAAKELFLTPSAISHQIKALEENLGIVLFKRLSRGVQLTAAGKSYLLVVQDVFQRLAAGTNSLRQAFSSQPLRISTFSTIANNIILPRLSQFQAELPHIKLKIDTRSEWVDLRYEEFDLALRLGNGDWPGVISQKMFDLAVTPLCSPAFYKKHQLSDARQILTLPLLQLSNMEDSWTRWGDDVGISGVEPNASIALSSYDATIQAAQQGLGLALGALPLENSAIKSGQLIRPFKEISEYTLACYATYRANDKQADYISAFIHWFKQQVEPDVND